MQSCIIVALLSLYILPPHRSNRNHVWDFFLNNLVQGLGPLAKDGFFCCKNELFSFISSLLIRVSFLHLHSHTHNLVTSANLSLLSIVSMHKYMKRIIKDTLIRLILKTYHKIMAFKHSPSANEIFHCWRAQNDRQTDRQTEGRGRKKEI